MNTVNFSGGDQQPSKVVCVGRNYLDHIRELENSIPEQMVLFFKSNASIASDLRRIERGDELHFEGEICLGVEGGDFRYVGFGLDLTKRGVQDYLRKRGLPWERSKAFRGAALFSSFVAWKGSFEDLHMELWVDGMLVQSGGVPEMMNKPASIRDEIAGVIDFEDFDIVMTGTPKGVGKVSMGSRFEGVIYNGETELVRHVWDVAD
ncbi:fumarylacetoacetate hydrolase family protein [Pelagicoccus sp. SDUM812002]|uniref:fumarylacetoacetate hydrolase family protein n=1 Tax=Pelagicoccus sp. SDUM812002 TaxID=3041266 RepID=UPI00280E60CA|nr:fumarylacetoacetate hydrolase family protein [Pelagicoccus sp. SDUM812002]MDQ8185122.1 fumarylacetoacetate hydrolase family protein [Pelagicoccus sp. SDUM812002]